MKKEQMKKAYFVGLCLISIVSCSAPGDELDNVNESPTLNASGNNMMAKGGFRDNPDTPTPPPAGIWTKFFSLTNPIYGFYSNHTKKHLYINYSRVEMLPKSYSGLSYYYLDRLIGSADGPGPAISAWFNTITNDQVLTTNPNEINGQSNWEKSNLGTSYNGDEPGSFPIYRYFNGDKKTHFYTRDKNELGDGKDGYVYEGIAFYLKDSPPKDFRIRDGELFQDNNTGTLYIVFESTLRRIESFAVINNLFAVQGKAYLLSKVNIEEYTGERGADITSSTQLVQNTNDGKMYLVDDGLYRYIPSMQIFNTYKFNPDAIQHKPVRMMFKGKDVAKTY
ncbi:hypothetical protein REB14_16005 [Chryseobacterium sp. ES2]|uniref:DUF5648 domain-containing protein n=1 Tax=Chryseobacterium metallicongregator TaxID=3073042 RepID=A0ABU1E772_9FLAO|nr:hypothetical protein [Chryseobacterium sp. ES2]MDR4953682.1 hypothetical protein [Chryseobacterium sp. ES2]